MALLNPYGSSVEPIEIEGGPHLKSAVTPVADDLLLLNPAWVRADRFPGMGILEVDVAEPHGANALRIGSAVVYQPCFPRTRDRLERTGLCVVPVDASELGKAEGGLTCCSLLLTP
jgi:dimethylargininase